MTMDPTPVGGLPFTFKVPAKDMPKKVSGHLEEAELAAKVARTLERAACLALFEAKAARDISAYAEARVSLHEALDLLLPTELTLAAILLQRGLPLEGRTMISLC